MSVSCGVECVFVLGCARWLWKRCTYVGSYDSATWPAATADEFEPVPRVCRIILAIYEPDLRNPQYYKPETGYRLNPDWVIKRVAYEETQGNSPPYIIYADHDHREIVMAVRGLNLMKESDYKVLLDNKLGEQMFDGGYVHHGLLKSAVWLLNRESETLKRLWVDNGSDYDMVFAGHSLGSGVVSLLTILVVNHRERLGGIPKEKIRCYAIAPARCMSLNLAVKYANVIHSIILQDDFLPRTPTPLEDIFKSIFCLPCLLFLVCLRDTFIPEGRKLRDPRRLYAPGRMYHIVERKFCRDIKPSSDVIYPIFIGETQAAISSFQSRKVFNIFGISNYKTDSPKLSECGRFPPEVRTAIPVDGRFEHIVLSCNTTADHAIIWIEREAEKAIQLMKDQTSETMTSPPPVQKFERLKTIEKEHKDALERVVSLNVPHAVENAEEEKNEEEEASSSGSKEASSTSTPSKSNWDEVVEKLLKKKETGDQHLEKDTSASQ